jgi:hypothetical protein
VRARQVRNLAYPRRRQESQAHQALRGGKTGCFYQADEPSIPTTESGHDRELGSLRLSHPRLSGIQHAQRARELALASAGHVDLEQEDGHGLNGCPVPGSPHRGEHRAGT